MSDRAIRASGITRKEAINEPRYRDHIPVMLGGSGEKKTSRLAAQYANHLTIIAPLDELPAKLRVLEQRCEEADRERSSLETSCRLTVVVDGEDSRDMDEGLPGRRVTGSPEQVADEIKRRVFDIGVDGVIINLPTHR